MDTRKNKIQRDYDNFHIEFENWFRIIQPNRDIGKWVSLYDMGYYKDSYAQGSWIAWLFLTNKRK